MLFCAIPDQVCKILLPFLRKLRIVIKTINLGLYQYSTFLQVVLTDYELVERLQKGDVEAFDLIYDKYSCKLYAFGLEISSFDRGSRRACSIGFSEDMGKL